MNRKAFSLVEVVVALAIYTLISFAFYFFIKTAMDANKIATQLGQGTQAAQAKMEELEAVSFDELLSYNGHKFAKGKGGILVTDVFADLKGVRLELKWNEDKAPIRLNTLRSRYE